VRESLPWSLAGLIAGLAVFFAILRNFTQAELPAFGIMAASLAVILAYRLARKLALPPLLITAASTLTFVLALPRPITFAEPVAYLRIVGESGLLLAIVVAAVTAYAYRLARAIGITAVLLVAVGCFAAHLSLGNALIALMQPLGKLGDTYTALLLITIAETLLWLVGIHGPAMLAAIVTPIYVTLQMQNTAAYAAHRPLPHLVVVSLFLFVFPGGAGATLPLAAMLAASKAERLRKIGRVSVIPAIFNISEPLLFGLPIVFNPFLAVPFVLVPVTLATITYLAVAYGFVSAPWQYVPSALPSVFGTYLATFDARAVLLVLVNIAVATVLYYPFFKALERDTLRQAQRDTVTAA
jgi:PTS system cellobiose-specific IIC component